MRERKIRDLIESRIELLGGSFRSTKYLGRRDCPDLLVLFPNEKRHLMIEAKRPNKDAEESQAREHVKLRAAGIEVVVISCIEELDHHLPRK